MIDRRPSRREPGVSKEVITLQNEFGQLFKKEVENNTSASDLESTVMRVSRQGLEFDMQKVYRALARLKKDWYPIAIPMENAPEGKVSRLPHTKGKNYIFYTEFVHGDYGFVHNKLHDMGISFEENSERLKNAGLLVAE